ncbi:MAG: RIP metalloprotease RseP [Methylococcales symbiont of Hymedesmia sp. n. MRB-2018]|nr:MAG: RIP metalloprotease RseP [Methylococcales symbiont of Hymedesmia sp. n. MRB-2018]KAF3984151.1 MAG: RIP metalloprotease RseP [Methylococcales symbiont of Hymedesmia sp. n. MRB-2018]
MDTLYTLFHFIVAIGILVSFHEFGHFWVARRVGVKVIRFSVGFGKVVYSYQKTPDSTEYVLSSIPLGGYVKMVDEREGDVKEADLPFAFNRQSLLARAAIVAAGPIFNLLLAIVLFCSVFMIGETGLRPVIGEIESGTLLAEAGFVEGEEIIAINNKATPIWSETINLLFSFAMQGEQEIIVSVKNRDDIEKNHILKIKKEDIKQPELLFKRLGIKPWSPELAPVIGEVFDAGRAKQVGLQKGDLIITADNEAITDWIQWVEYVKDRPEITIQLIIERAGVQMAFALVPEKIEGQEKDYGRIGASVDIPEQLMAYLKVEYSLPPYKALIASIKKTWFFSTNTLQMMGKILIGQASPKNLSGPISIAQYAGKTAEMGLIPFLKFLAAISISLGVLNLLPIPMLDGGHLMFFAIEAIKGSPVPEKIQIVFQNFGMLCLFFLMIFVIFLDIERLLDK